MTTKRISLAKAYWTMTSRTQDDDVICFHLSGEDGEIEFTMSLFNIGIMQSVMSDLLYRAACPDLENQRKERVREWARNEGEDLERIDRILAMDENEDQSPG